MLVEDDAMLAQGLNSVLHDAGLTVDVQPLGESADAQLQREPYDLLLLDIGLPDIDGFELLTRLRARGSSMPVLLLTARDQISDRVQGFDLGGDDYVVKPFAIDELLARVRSLLRRHPARATRLSYGPLTMDLTAKRAWDDERSLDLSVREWMVLEHLLRNTDKVISKQQMTEAIRGSDATLTPNAVEVYISRLRGKLEHSCVRIRTIHGFGYMLESRSSSTHEHP
jgi:DNA-binding response OmpR family regulator